MVIFRSGELRLTIRKQYTRRGIRAEPMPADKRLHHHIKGELRRVGEEGGEQREREPSVGILAASSWRTHAKTSVAGEFNGLAGT